MKVKKIVFIDMDQTICNFNKSYEQHFQMSIRDYEKMFGRKKLEKDLNSLGKKFWVELEPLPEALKLWNFCVSNFEKVFILSSPGVYDHSKSGKTEWLENFTKGNFLAIYDRDKYKYIDPKVKSVLIDDYDKNIRLWKQNGGIGILFESTSQAIKELEKIIQRGN